MAYNPAGAHAKQLSYVHSENRRCLRNVNVLGFASIVLDLTNHCEEVLPAKCRVGEANDRSSLRD